MYLWLANFVTLTHALLVVGQILGGAAAISGLLRRSRSLERIYYALLAGVVASDLLLGECFLTHWEKVLRDWHEPGSAYRGSFIGHYVPGLPPALLAWFIPALIAAAVLAYPFWRWIDARSRSKATGSGSRSWSLRG